MARTLPTLALLLGALLAGVHAARDVGELKALGNVGDDGMCQTCLVAMRVLEDALCDEAAVDFIVDFAKKDLCPATPDVQQCSDLADALLPVAVEWLRASATPASLCAAAGVCSSAMLGDAMWDKPAVRLTDDFGCPLCKHVLGRVATSVASAAEAGSVAAAVGDAQALAAARAACGALPGDMARACEAEMHKRASLLRMAVGAQGERDVAEGCELLGMCVAGLARFKAPPLGLGLVRALAEAQPRLGRAGGQLQAAMTTPSLRGNGCDACKLTVLEVATLLANPAFQDGLRTYTESLCDAAPPQYGPICKAEVDTYVPMLLQLLQQYVQPDDLCVRMHFCERASAWEELLMGVFAPLGKLLGANLP